MKRKIPRLLFSIVAFTMVVTACKADNQPDITAIPTIVPIDVGDGGFFSNHPCGPPCFLGIQPDRTTYDEAMDILSTNEYLEYCREWNNEHDGGGRGITCGDSFVISLDPDGKLVTGLGFDPTSIITVQDVVDQFGDPANVSVTSGGYAKTTSVMQLLYPQNKMIIILERQDGEVFIVSPDTEVDTVAYDGEKHYETFIKWAQKWSGFGEYIMQ